MNVDEYHKIQTVFKRDPATKNKTLLDGEWSLPEFEYLKDNTWVFTEKVDGTNIRVYLDNGQVTFGGRSDKAQIPAQLVTALNSHFQPLTDKMRNVFGDADVCLYGEGYGAKIQKGGGNYRPDQGFVLFDVMVDGWWLRRENMLEVAEELALATTPVIGAGTLLDAVERVREGIESTWGPFQAEGIVARPEVELKDRGGNRVITKIKCRDFKRVADER